MGAPLQVMLDKAGSATTWKEKFPNALISATE